MNAKRFFVILTFIFLFMLGLWLPVNAAPVGQVIVTPTAGVDGRIIYIVQPGETCIRVAAINGITVDQLRQFNSKLDENCTLVEGQELLIGIISLAGTPTAGPSPTSLPPTASPTPFTGTTQICVLLYEDTNGNTLRDANESAIEGGAISVTEINGEYSASLGTIANTDPEYQGECFQDVPEGEYNITVGVPDAYNPTVSLNNTLKVNAGDQASLSFGAQSREIVANPDSAANQDGGSSPIFGILGTLFLLGGAGLGYYAWRSGRPESKLAGGGMLKK
ncbi:MAG: LysM peptidoglycan-binding domain-containing protein [Anaerolineales bacterium]|nr:LysM peptidoglycan-binding domain-containing protein [Anaerolineales bacterium]